MYLSDYLHEIPLKALKRIAGHLGVSVEYQARIKLMNAIDRAFWDGSLFSRLAQGLTDIARLILSIVAFSYDAGIRESALLRKMERLTGARRREVRDILDELILSVLVGGVKYEEPVYFCPRGIAEQARIILLKDFVVPPSSEQPAFSPFPSLMEDIIALLAAAYREPVPLTQKKHIRRNVLEKTFAGSLTGKDAPEHFSAEHRDSFVTGYLSARNLMHLGDRSATVTPALDGWLGLSMTERIQDAVSFALMYVLGDIQTIVPFAGIISELPIGASFEPSVLAKFLHERTTASGNVSRLAGRIWQMASILNYLGLLLYREGRFVMTGAGSGFFHGEPLPIDKNNADQFTLQPNFETLAGPELDLRTRFTLELMSYRKSRDVVITSVVNRRGVARARERGMSVGQIMSFFETHSRTPVPQNIRFSIENWAKAYGSIRFEPVMLMRFHDPSMCESVLHMPEMKHYIRERLSDTIVTIPADRFRVIADILRKAGFLPEITGEYKPDSANSGEIFQTFSIQEMLSEHTLPETAGNFVFPEKAAEETS